MSYDVCRRSDRRTSDGIATVRDRQVRVLAHEGKHSAPLRRHETECSGSDLTDADRLRLYAQAQRLCTDERTMMVAIEDLSQDGPKAPGPNGIRLHDLDRRQRWGLARTLRVVTRNGTYHRNQTRQVEIPKGNGKPGTRTLDIPNIEDQVVQKAVVLAIQPLLDPIFDDRSFGFRPYRGREDALATAQILAQQNGYQVLLLEDLKDAFTTVPHARLLQVLRHHGFHDDTVELVRQCIRNECNRGLPQGGSLSPLLLNAYLDHHLDRLWRRQMPNTPLIRYADDLCVLCKSVEEAQQAYAKLRQLIQPTGMSLKGRPDTAIHDLSRPDAQADWLGYQLSCQDGDITPGLSGDSWTCLEEFLRMAHEDPYASVAAYDSICGWVDQLGICLRDDLSCTYQRIVDLAELNGFEELPTLRELETIRDRAVRRFEETRRVVLYGISVGSADGSADLHLEAASTGRTSGAPTGAGTTHTPDSAGTPPADFWIWTDGACLRQYGCGGWASIVESRVIGLSRMCRSGAVPKTTNNRMELTAVIEALRSLTGRQHVRLITDSKYVRDGINRIHEFRRNRWHDRRGGRLRNLDLWLDLDRLLREHNVECVWVRGHAGEPNNEECDRMAAAAAAAMLASLRWAPMGAEGGIPIWA